MLQAHTDIPVQEEYQLALYVTIDAHKKIISNLAR